MRGEGARAAVAGRLRMARAFAGEAASVGMAEFRKPTLRVEAKEDGSHVTPVDREIERLFRDRVAEEFPEDGVLGEEFGETAGEGSCRWIVDPIDGTHGYIRGLPLWATLIGIEWDGVLAAGLASFPALGELVYGGPGLGVMEQADAAWVDGSGGERACVVSDVDGMDDGILELSKPQTWAGAGEERTLARLIETTSKSRGWDDAYSFALVATGRVEAAVSLRMKLWDVAAFVPIVTAAGGRMTDWDGASATDGGRTIASNGLVHDRLVEAVAG